MQGMVSWASFYDALGISDKSSRQINHGSAWEEPRARVHCRFLEMGRRSAGHD
jgi:hypothetical protein